MIERLKQKHNMDLYTFTQDVKDRYEDFYITINRERIFLNNLNMINRLLKYQEVYGLFEKDLQAVMIVYREKGFRPFLKILSKSNKYAYQILNFLFWNFHEEIFIKIKKENRMKNIILNFRIGKEKKPGFQFVGDRGNEILFKKYKGE